MRSVQTGAGLRSGRLGGVFAIGFGLFLSACTTGGLSGLESRLFNQASQPSSGVAGTLPPDYFLQNASCPEPELRAGAEVLRVHDRRGATDDDSIRYQASIGQMARECRTEAGMIRIKLGIAGRVVAGPKGRAETVSLPVRIVVTKGGSVAFSQLRPVSVTLANPVLSSDFTLVDDQISFAVATGDELVRLYVGFDEGGGRR